MITCVQVLAPLPIGFAVFVVHLATIPITGTGINPARSFGAAVIYNNKKIWDDQVRPPFFGSGIFTNTLHAFDYFKFLTNGYFCDVGAVDLLARTLPRSSCRSRIPPVHSESRRHQSFGILPQQPQQLNEKKKLERNWHVYFFVLCYLIC